MLHGPEGGGGVVRIHVENGMEDTRWSGFKFNWLDKHLIFDRFLLTEA